MPAAIACAWLCGCASVQSLPAVPMAESVASEARYFVMRGRISVRVGDRIETGRLHWSRLSGEERLEFFTPFGSQVAELVNVPRQPVVLRRGHETTSASSVGELTSSLLGMPLDMDAIAQWTQGIGLTEERAVERRFANGDVWSVTASQVRTRGPHRVAERLSAVSGDAVVRLAIDEWEAH